MKKYFMFATVAIAALFASCSNSDDFVAPQVISEDVDSGDALVPIQIGVGSHVDVSTRGTGTVGSIGGDVDDSEWNGQLINVYMFKKGTLDLSMEKDPNGTDADVPIFNNQLMITPGSGVGIAPTSEHTGKAMVWDLDDAGKRGVIKYYPQLGNYDFFGYHGDNATAVPTLNSEGNAYEADFTIDGSQDLMSTKAVEYGTWPNATDDVTRYFSAYSGRRGIHPNLPFDHLLTRLQFNIKAGDEGAAGVEAGVQVDPSTSAYKGVKVKSIEIFSRKSGKLLTAWTSEAGVQDPVNNTEDEKLQIRASKIKWNDIVYDATDPDANTCGWLALKQRPGTDPSANLVPLEPVAPDYNAAALDVADKFPFKQVGEALIVSKPLTVTPNAEHTDAASVGTEGDTYFIRIAIVQNVSGNHMSEVPGEKPFTTVTSFTAPSGESGFKLGYSYNVNLVLYGAEEIKVYTTIAPWSVITKPIDLPVE